jgi:hypothetical protein
MISFKYVVFSLLCLILVSFASFTINSIDIRVYVQEDGSASVTEEFSIYIQGKESIDLYEDSLTTLDRNNIQSWIYKLQLPDLVYHIGGQYVDVDNFVILPEPVQKIYEDGYTRISITYDILESKNINADGSLNNRGLFILENIKPRTTRYILNKNAFLNLNQNGDLILPQNTKLNFLIPEGAIVTNLYPLTDTLRESHPPFYTSAISWTKPILPKLTFEFEIERTLESEIIDFFNSIQENINKSFKGPEGLAYGFLIIAGIISLIYLHKINKRDV